MEENGTDDSVQILDSTCSEPFLNRGCHVPKMEESVRDDSVEILDDIPPSERRSEKSVPPHIQFSRKRRPKLTDKSENTSNHEAFVHSMGPQADRVKPVKSNVDEYIYSPIQGVGDGPKRYRPSKFSTGTKRIALDTGKVRALQSARAFKSEYPFFMVVM